MEDTMRELHREELGDRRVRLLASPDGRYTVTIAVRGHTGDGKTSVWSPIAILHCTRPAYVIVSA